MENNDNFETPQKQGNPTVDETPKAVLFSNYKVDPKQNITPPIRIKTRPRITQHMVQQ
jgi:hypothetical protein